MAALSLSVIVSYLFSLSKSFFDTNLSFVFVPSTALAASGARILTDLVYELKDRKAKYAIGSACIGGGQGIAVLIENIN